jgi:hypothetical protein
MKGDCRMEVRPIIGILSIPRASNSPFFGGQNESFAEIVTFAERMNCIAFVFCPDDIDWARNTIWGYKYNLNNTENEWERQLFPMPNIIYNRIPNRTLEKREEVSKTIDLLIQKYGPRFFNPCFLDKWQTHKMLFSNYQTRRFLPATQLIHESGVITNMLKRYKSVFVKPTANSLGHDMMKIERVSPDSYYFIHQTLTNQRQGFASSFKELLKALLSITNGAATTYLVQQTIALAKCEGRPFDLRLLVQKNRQGHWQKTGMAARIAGRESITTHVFYGGKRYSALKAISSAAKTHKFSPEKVNNQLNNLISLFPKTIERAVGQSFGELEMDLGIDQQGKVWFFEANSKPFRFDEKFLRAKSLVRLIHYTKYLDARHFNSLEK